MTPTPVNHCLVLPTFYSVEGFSNANFLISQPNPMLCHSFESSLQDDSNECSQHRIRLRSKEIMQKMLIELILLWLCEQSSSLTLFEGDTEVVLNTTEGMIVPIVVHKCATSQRTAEIYDT